MVKRTLVLLLLAAVQISMLGTVNCNDDGDNDKKRCGKNMVYSDCGGSCPRTCLDIANMGAPKVCPAVCKPGCSCQRGYVLHEGVCIPEKECPCQGNAEYKECGGACRLTCEDVANMVPKVCPRICIGGCICKEGYALNSGKCVPKKQCLCKKNAQYNGCGGCQRTCEDVANNVTAVPCTKECKQGCYCDKGYVVSGTECLLEKDCPCNDNAHYACGTVCPLTCDNYRNPPKSCTKQCVLGCHCDKGYVKSGNACVRPEKCPKGTIE